MGAAVAAASGGAAAVPMWAPMLQQAAKLPSRATLTDPATHSTQRTPIGCSSRVGATEPRHGVAAAIACGAFATACRIRRNSRGHLPQQNKDVACRAKRGNADDISFERLYKPPTYMEEREDERQQGDWDRRESIDYTGTERRRPLPGKRAAKWRQDDAALRNHPAYAKRWQWDKKSKGKKKKWTRGYAVDQLQEMDESASKMRANYKRPRFGWKEVQQDDLRMERLSEDLPAIGTGEVWLSKYLAHCGACSRRAVTDMVLQGRVEVNGEVAQVPTIKVKPGQDRVLFDGQPMILRTLGEVIWIILYKPRGVISTMDDPEGRKTIMDLVPFAKKRRLLPIGRIDRAASGLMILTNDYEWHTILTHPRYELAKRYKVQVYNGKLTWNKIRALQAGLELPDEQRRCLPLEDIDMSMEDKSNQIATLKFTMREGRYRQILRMFEFLGHPIKSTKRIGFGLLNIRDLRPGEYRVLGPKEIRKLKGPTILKKPRGDPLNVQKDMAEPPKSTRRNDERRRQMLEEDDMPGLDSEERRAMSRSRAGGWSGDSSARDMSNAISDYLNADMLASNRDRIVESQAGSAAELDSLTQRFSHMGDFDVSPSSDEMEDQNWIEQLDDMQADGKTPRAGRRYAPPTANDEDSDVDWIGQLDAMLANKAGSGKGKSAGNKTVR